MRLQLLAEFIEFGVAGQLFCVSFPGFYVLLFFKIVPQHTHDHGTSNHQESHVKSYGDRAKQKGFINIIAGKKTYQCQFNCGGPDDAYYYAPNQEVEVVFIVGTIIAKCMNDQDSCSRQKSIGANAVGKRDMPRNIEVAQHNIVHRRPQYPAGCKDPPVSPGVQW